MALNHLIIDLGAIKDNFFILKKLAGKDGQVLPVVKADAYGHGAVAVTKTLESTGCELFAVFELDEAIILRKAGIKASIILLMGITSEEVEKALNYNVIPALYRFDIARKLSKAAIKKNKEISVHIKLDTGMGRLGIYPDELNSFINKIRLLPGINISGIFSHFSVSDKASNNFNDIQLNLFNSAIARYKNQNLTFHIANTGGIIGQVGQDMPMSRAGIALYGALPGHDHKLNYGLKQAMHFRSRVIFIKDYPADSPVSYGMTYKTGKLTKIATIPVGYNDGYNRGLSNKGEVLIHGIRAPVIGMICMNLTMIDVTHIANVQIGDEVVLMGKQRDDIITADEISSKIGTISYEIFCILGKCNPKIYKKYK